MTSDNGSFAVEARGLVKRFGDVCALDGVDLEVASGTVLGVLGPNGAGKTTAVRILATVLTPDEGSARVLGLDVARQAPEVRARIGLAGQFAAVDGNLTGRENLMLVGSLTHLPRRALGPRADELLARFGLSDAAGRLARTYSGGMRRRLDLAAALVHRPPVLFLDEPTTGLDVMSRSDLWAVVRELVAEGTTVLLTTQYLEEADHLADRIMVIDHGRVIADGTAAELKSRLGATVVELAFADEAQSGLAAAALEPLDLGRLDRDNGTVRLSVREGARALMDVLRTLDARGLAPQGAAVREPSLDDVFLTLTGRRAEAEQPAEQATAAPGPARFAEEAA